MSTILFSKRTEMKPLGKYSPYVTLEAQLRKVIKGTIMG